MGKKPKLPKASATGSRRRRATRSAATGLLALAVVVGILAALGWAGNEALHRIGSRDRYRAHFADVQCDAPPGLDRRKFLAEVRYVADLPESFHPLDAADRDRLAAAFARHPWVESVDGVTVEAANRVSVKLTFRTPVLAVQVEGGSVRHVDGNGVLLPESAARPAVADLATEVPAPSTPAGRVWADDRVKRAVELVRVYKPTRLEQTPTGWRLTLPDGKTFRIG